MALLLALWGILFLGLGVVMFTMSRTSIDSIATLLCFLIAIVGIGCAGIIDQLQKSDKKKVNN